jgi:TPP-dependent pyruvate/acetoin dehydrogenase alpha subunit
MDVTMRMPALGTVDDTIKVVRWLVQVGQSIQRGQPLVEVETDKSIMELESTVTGRLQSQNVPAGGEAAPGQIIATFAMLSDPQPEPEGQVDKAVPEQWAVEPARGVVTIARAGAVPVSKPQAQPRAAVRNPDRVSFFQRNRQARAQPPRPGEEHEYTREFLRDLYERMVMIREFEEGVKFLFLEGSMPGTIHQCQGQEATAVGVCAALDGGDFITSTFRGHGHALAKGLSPEELLFELFGASTGCCRGKGGSMHVGNMEKGMVPGIAIVGGGIPLAAGMALALKMQQRHAIVACFFGDGAISEGAFHEGVNLAAIWDLPVIFVCENNLYGASTKVDLVMRNPRIADRGAAYGIRAEQLDGNNVLAVYEAARAAAAECRSGHGPVLLELMTYRRTGHSRRDACHYQPKDERDAWFARDPIVKLGRLMMERGMAEQQELDGIRAQAQSRFQAAVESARRQPMPAASDLTTDVFA